MSSKPHLNDLQLILLATAIQREDGSILPPPESVGPQSERIRKAIPALLRRQLIVNAPVTDRSKAWREEDQQVIGLVITDLGRTKLADGVPQEQAHASAAGEPPKVAVTNPPRTSHRSGSKTDTLIGLLRNDGGVTLAGARRDWSRPSTRSMRSVRRALVADALARDGIGSPQRRTATRKAFGGCAFTRGQLYAILKNPILRWRHPAPG